jgi:hypothetical protein
MIGMMLISLKQTHVYNKPSLLSLIRPSHLSPLSISQFLFFTSLPLVTKSASDPRPICVRQLPSTLLQQVWVESVLHIVPSHMNWVSRGDE